MSGDANEAVRLKEEADAKRGFDSESDSANQKGGDAPRPSGHADRDPETDMPTAPQTDDAAGEDVDAMPQGDRPRPAHG